MSGESSPELRRIVFVGVGAVIMGITLVVVLLQARPSSAPKQGRTGDIKGLEMVGVQAKATSLEGPVIRAAGPGTALLVGAKSSGGTWSFTRPGVATPTATLALTAVERVELGERPVWVHVAASWCLPCLWEMEPLLASAGRLLNDEGGSVVLAVVDADGDPARGLGQLLDRHAQLGKTTRLTAPSGLTIVADDARRFGALADALVVPASQGPSAGVSELRKQGIPLSLVFDRCGALVLVAQNRHNAATFERIEQTVRDLAARKTPCH